MEHVDVWQVLLTGGLATLGWLGRSIVKRIDELDARFHQINERISSVRESYVHKDEFRYMLTEMNNRFDRIEQLLHNRQEKP